MSEPDHAVMTTLRWFVAPPVPEAALGWVEALGTLAVVAALGVTAARILRRQSHRRQERARQQAAGAEARDRLALVLENATDLVAFLDPQCRPLYLNRSGRRLLGLAADVEVGSLNLDDFYVPWTRTLLAEEGLPTALRDGSWRGQTAVRRRDGQEIALSQVVTAHRKPDGALDFISTIVRDITPIKQTERALQTSESRFRSLIEACPMGIHTYELMPDDQLVFAGANPAADRILGVDNSAFIGLPIEQAFPPLAQTDIPAAFRRAATQGVPWSSDQVDYEHGPIRGSFEAYAFQTAPGRIAVMFSEITARRQAELALRDSEERFRQLASAITEVFWLREWPERRVLYVSPAFECLWGQDPAAAYHDPEFWQRSMHPEDVGRVERSLPAGLESGQWSEEYRILRPDGTMRWVRDRAFPIRNGEGRICRVAGVAEDITERRKTQAVERVLQRIAQALTVSCTLRDLARLLARECFGLFGHNAFFLELFDPATGERQGIYAEETPPGARTPAEVTVRGIRMHPELQETLTEGHARLISRQIPDPADAFGSWGFGERPCRSLMLCPVLREGRPIGLIALHSAVADCYGPRDLELLRMLADHSATAIARIQAEDTLRQLNHDLEAKVRQRTEELQRIANLMGGREVRMAELKAEIVRLREALGRGPSAPAAPRSPPTDA